MAKVAKIKESSILVVLDDGTMTEIPVTRFNFDPEVGVEVDIVGSESEQIVKKKEV